MDEVFHALSHPARREIVARLATGSTTVGEVARPLGMTAPAVTKHLKVLEGAGLVDRRIIGRQHHLSLVTGPLGSAAGWIEGIEQFWERGLDRLAHTLEGT